jgi:hypothetical protein
MPRNRRRNRRTEAKFGAIERPRSEPHRMSPATVWLQTERAVFPGRSCAGPSPGASQHDALGRVAFEEPQQHSRNGLLLFIQGSGFLPERFVSQSWVHPRVLSR